MKSLRFEKINDAISAANQAYNAYSRIKDYVEQKRSDRTYNVIVSEDETALFNSVHQWISETTLDESRNVEVIRWKNRVHMRQSGDSSRVMDVRGHRITVSTAVPEQKSSGDGAVQAEHRGNPFARRRVTFSSSTPAGRSAVMEFLSELSVLINSDPPSVMSCGSWGEWNRSGPADRRPVDSVILRKGVKEDLLDDLSKFLRQEQIYNELGIPWHRGYLLEGPPGSGKSSIAQIMAAYARCNLYAMNLHSVKNDSELTNLISNINGSSDGSPSILALEDIDTLVAAKSRDHDSKGAGVTLEGLLNVLDGLSTPNGLITVMTTNEVTRLDPALIRPGRADYRLHIGYVDEYQFTELCRRFVGDTDGLPEVTEEHRITPAELVEVFKRHLDAPAGAYEDIVEFVKNRSFGELVNALNE